MSVVEHAEEETKELRVGLILKGRYRIVDHWKDGGCGSIFELDDLDKEKNQNPVVLKVEQNESKTLDMEASVLRRLMGSRFRELFCHMFAAGYGAGYKYIVMKRMGGTLDDITRRHRPVSHGTQLRAAIQILGGLKALHEVGFLHRDVSPNNIAVGFSGTSAERQLFLFDFGICRPWNAPQRIFPKFRGKDDYAPLAVMERKEGGRRGDIESLTYTLQTLIDDLPWKGERDHEVVLNKKKNTELRKLYLGSHHAVAQMAAVIRFRDQKVQPDYRLLHKICHDSLASLKISFADSWDWETELPTQETTPNPFVAEFFDDSEVDAF